MHTTFPRILGSCLIAVSLVASSCGDGNEATQAVESSSPPTVSPTTAAPAASTAPPTTAAPATTAPATSAPATVSLPPGVDAAVAGALDASRALAGLRTDCLTGQDPLGCLVQADADIAAAETAAVEALVAMGAAVTDAGLPEARCAELVGYTAENIATERALLFARANAVLTLAESPGVPEWNYFGGLVDERIAPAGHELALVILGCVGNVRNLTDESTIARSVSNVVFNSDVRTRPSLAYNLWTVSFCIGRAPVDDQSCFDGLGMPGPLVSHLEELGYSYDDLLADPDYAGLPADCRTAIEESTARLRSAYEIFLDISARELTFDDLFLLESLTDAVYQVEDQRRSGMSMPMYPLDESTVIECAAAVAGATG